MGRPSDPLIIKNPQTGIAGVLQRNLLFLMQQHGLERGDIDRMNKEGKVDVQGKFIKQLIEGDRSFPKIDKLEEIARIFNLKAWQLLRPTLTKELTADGYVEELIERYLEATDEGRGHIRNTAEIVPKKPS